MNQRIKDDAKSVTEIRRNKFLAKRICIFLIDVTKTLIDLFLQSRNEKKMVNERLHYTKMFLYPSGKVLFITLSGF